MSSPRTLLEMPQNEMLIILKQCDLNSILTLRKTCHALRNFIDTTKPCVQVAAIHIRMRSESLIKMAFVGTPIKLDDGYTEVIRTDITYGRCGLNQRIYNRENSYSGFNRKHVDFEENFLKVFARDLQIISKVQKSPIPFIHFSFRKMENPKVFDKIQKFFEVLNFSIKAKKFMITAQKQSGIPKLLPFVCAKSMETLRIKYYDKTELAKELVETEQWKSAKNVEIYDFNPKMIDHCLHFTNIRVDCVRFPLEDVDVLREKIRKVPHYCSLKIDFCDSGCAAYDALKAEKWELKSDVPEEE